VVVKLYHPIEVVQRKVRPFISLFKQLFGIRTLQSKVGRPPELSPVEAVTYGVLNKRGRSRRRSRRGRILDSGNAAHTRPTNGLGYDCPRFEGE